jgi:hypothetical protein
MLKKIFLFVLLQTLLISLFAQQKTELKGVVYTRLNKPLELVNVSVKDHPGGAISNEQGEFSLTIEAKFPLVLVFSRIGYEVTEIELKAVSQAKGIKVELSERSESIETIDVTAKNGRNQNFTKIDAKLVSALPDVSGGSIEALVKTQMGVTSNNELSSQYRVRGGNFDENLVYVNDIEIYRPLLVRSGQQEGLSFVNPDMVSDIRFSAGGFDARYGDKMSSVLDIKYKSPSSFAGSTSASLLGGKIHIEGASKNSRFTHITGVRYKTNRYLLGTMDVSGDYQPSFFDLQSYMTYRISNRWRFSILGNLSQNKYNFKPVDRETSFGTLSEAKQLKIYFEGRERDMFQTGFVAGSLDFSPNNDHNFKWIVSGYRTSEEENYDILGQYWIQDLDPTGEVVNDNAKLASGIGVGTYMEHARNYLFGNIANVAFRGSHRIFTHNIEWEVKYQYERFYDIVDEWEMRDSAGYSVPLSDTQLVMAYAYDDENDIESNRISGFIQENKHFYLSQAKIDFAFGIRSNYWDFNDEWLVSPRMSIRIDPEWERDYHFKFAAGLYYQSPFFKEYRAQGQVVNRHIKSQKSIHFVTGFDYYFLSRERPFKFSTELYYKQMDNLIPYQIDNVRIRYSAKNNAKGYVAGLDMKINGELVKGVESWASLSVMKSQEDLKDDYYIDSNTGQTIYPGYIPRPSDQRVNFSMMFQDYFPKNPSYKVNLNFIYGSGLPFGPPRSARYLAVNRMPAYRRVDVGISKEITGTQLNPNKQTRGFKNLWIGLEVFNLFDINNTISYLWVTDVNNRQYAVPNYLTSRRLNMKLVARF